MNGDELRKILCRMAPGMSLSVPDEWVDKTIAGTRVARAKLVDEIARQYGCCCIQDFGTQRFEKLDIPYTG